MSPDVLTLLNSTAKPPEEKNLTIEMLSLEGVSYAKLHQFPDAERTLQQAENLCANSSAAECGNVIRARGVLAVEKGESVPAEQSFQRSLSFARAHADHFLEATALLNLGLIAQRQDHFDEAIQWTEAANQIAMSSGAYGVAQVARGNLGWAYYNLGDSEKSLKLSLEAEDQASRTERPIDQLYWITNIGYVYADRGDFSRASQSYVKALDLASRIKDKEGIYNALRALALVSVESGDLKQAQDYSDQAIAMARADNNRLNELYPLLVKAQIAAQNGDSAQAETIFREVKQDEKSNASLKWRAEHGLARLYEVQKNHPLADAEYRAALATFESARSLLAHSDSKLPFSNNAASIYDDYIQFLIERGKPEDALRWADYSRARTLSEGLDLLSKAGSKGEHTGPPVLNAQEISRRVHAALLFYWLGEKQSYLWAITPHRISLFTLPAGAKLDSLVQRYRKDLQGPENVLDLSNDDGRALYRALVEPARALLGSAAKVYIIPDGSLNNLNFETLVVSEPKPHFWIEDTDIVNTSSLRVLNASRNDFNLRAKKIAPRLLLVGDSVAPSQDYPELPRAAAQMASVEKHFPATQQQVYQREKATPAAYFASTPEQFSHIHFVAHGTASRLSPLDSAIVLSKDAADSESFKLYARDIIRYPLKADLVTISACYSAGERFYSGEGLVGLAWAFLRAGSHNVIAGLWEVADVSTEQLMNQFYDELSKGVAPDLALRTAKLSLLRSGTFRSPFYWAPFQLYTGS